MVRKEIAKEIGEYGDKLMKSLDRSYRIITYLLEDLLLRSSIMLNVSHIVPVRQQIEHYLDELPQEQLNFVAELLAHLVSSEHATQELLNIPGFLESFIRGQEEIKIDCVADWKSLRNDL